MYLQKLEIQGFKSFANKTTLEFNKELTAIVGPNGSGKSNFADAVRWVLGEQSLKVLRGKKSQDVIFAGSDQKSRLGFAEVNLYLNNEDGRAPIDYSEVVITRRIYRDGEGEYLINKNKVRLSDVQMLMAKSSFGQRSYSIVGQGMVDSILTSSPQERKEFFDEATGVRQYQIKREQSLNKLERTYENLIQSQNVIKEIEPRLKSLTRQMKRLEEKEAAELDLKQLQNNYYSFLQDQLNNELKTKQASFAIVEQNRQSLETQLNDLQKELESIENEDGHSQTFNNLEGKYSRLITDKNNILQELSLLQGKIDLKLTTNGQGDTVWLRKKSEDLSIKLTAIKEQLALLSKEKETTEKSYEQKIKEQQQIVTDFNILKEKLLNKQGQGANQDYSEDLKKKINLLSDNYDDFLHKLEKIDNLEKLIDLQTEANNIATIINTIRRDLKEQNATDGEDIVWLEEKMNQFLTNKDNLVDEINEQKINLEIAKTKHHQFQEQYNQLAEEKQKIEDELKITTSTTADQKQTALIEQKVKLEKNLDEINNSLNLVKQKIDTFNSQVESKQTNLINIQKQTRDLQIKLNDQNNQINSINIDIAKLETKLEDLNKEILEELGSGWQSVSVKEEVHIIQTREKINSLKNKLALVGGIDDGVPTEYREVKERFEFLDDQVRDLDQSITTLTEVIKELDQKIDQQFKENFDTINQEFQKYFKILFNGGKSSLMIKQPTNNKVLAMEELIDDEEDKTEEISIIKKLKKTLTDTEIEIIASPPGKKISSINTLSGGEKAMTAIALICSIISANPSPFVILDEVDAALDEANAARYVAIINDLSDKTQFIAVTHNRVTMHHAAILYGVTMGADSVSRLLSVDLKEAETYSK
ncbi:MAG: AAA family ATPase [Candidatus Komeilibacteria bacterium]